MAFPHTSLIYGTLEELVLVASLEVHTIIITTHLWQILCVNPTANIIPAVVLATQFHTALSTNNTSYIFLRILNLDIILIRQFNGIESIFTYASTFANTVHVFNSTLTSRCIVICLIHSLSIVEISESQTIGKTLTLGDSTREIVVEYVQSFSHQITILWCIVGRRSLHIVTTIHEEVILTFTYCQP